MLETTNEQKRRSRIFYESFFARCLFSEVLNGFPLYRYSLIGWYGRIPSPYWGTPRYLKWSTFRSSWLPILTFSNFSFVGQPFFSYSLHHLKYFTTICTLHYYISSSIESILSSPAHHLIMSYARHHRPLNIIPPVSMAQAGHESIQ